MYIIYKNEVILISIYFIGYEGVKMLKSILFLGTGMALGCYYKSCKEKKRLSHNNSNTKLSDESKAQSQIETI